MPNRMRSQLARAQSELAEAAHTEAALQDQLERVKQGALEQTASLQAELASTRRHWEGRLNTAIAENHALSRQLLDTQRELQLANGRWESSVQNLQHSVLSCFAQTIEGGRNGAEADAAATATMVTAGGE